MKNITILPPVAVFSVCAIFALTTAALAQSSDPKAATTISRHSEAKDSKSPPVTLEKEPFVQLLFEVGYTSEYIFRGTNLMPDSDGGDFYNLLATFPKVGPGSLTLGFYAIHQLGTASSDSWSTSEGGGGAGANAIAIDSNDPDMTSEIATRSPTTTQSSFSEVDLFLSYKFSLGPIDVTLGNIAFFISRNSRTSELLTLPAGHFFAFPPTGTRFATLFDEPTVEEEQFDRLYIRLSSTKLCRHLTPSITYYQTINSWGSQPISKFFIATDAFGDKVLIPGPGPGGERNSALGGYLEGKVNGNFPVGRWLDINPYGIISVSFRDRTEPVNSSFVGSPLTGFNHVQAGLDLDFHITQHIAFVPFMAYSYHISEPPIGTSRNEVWGGARLAINF